MSDTEKIKSATIMELAEGLVDSLLSSANAEARGDFQRRGAECSVAKDILTEILSRKADA